MLASITIQYLVVNNEASTECVPENVNPDIKQCVYHHCLYQYVYMNALQRGRGLKEIYQRVGPRVRSSVLGRRSSVPKTLMENSI